MVMRKRAYLFDMVGETEAKRLLEIVSKALE